MKNAFLLYIKGMAMGAVDVVPGFSGGTMALITGIYDRLLAALAATPQALGLFVRGRIRQAWQACDASFLLVLLLGIATSMFSLAKGISYLMNHQPIALWSFFFGLVMVSVWLVGREVSLWRWDRMLGLVAGTAFAIWITLAAPLQLTADPVTLFFAGALAICAMILPGISGSFILVLLGLYPAVLGALKSFDLPVLAVFALGCLLGLMSFSRLLSWLLAHFHDLTLAFLSGIILGSLGKVWPWKQTLSWQTNSRGESYPLLQENLMPERYAAIIGQDPQLLLALSLAVLAIVLVLGIEWLGRRSAAVRPGLAD